MALLINAYSTLRSPPPLEFAHEMIGRRDHGDPELREHLNGFIGFVMQGGQREMTQSLYHVYRHIERVQHHLSVEVEEADLDSLAEWGWRANAILFLPNGNLCDPSGNILVNPDDGTADDEASVPYPQDAIDRKLKHDAELQQKNIPIAETLPPIVGEGEALFREAADVARRATALFLVALRAESLASGEEIPVSEMRERLPSTFDDLSPAESEFMNDANPDQQNVINHAWRYECLFFLQWALGHFDELHFPSEICDVKAVARNILDRDADEMIAKAKLRPAGQLLDAIDMHLRLHWAARQAAQTNQTPPASLDPGVLQERRYAMNWLIQFENAEWDDVDTPT